MEFPRCVYKRGTAKPVPGGGVGEFYAESRVVRSAEEADALGGGWVESPAEAGVAEPEPAPVAPKPRKGK